MEIVQLAPKDERLAAVYPVMKELRTELGEEQFHELYATGHEDGYRVVGLFSFHFVHILGSSAHE